MRYVTPEIILKDRFKDNPMPNWQAAILCFESMKRSEIIVQQFDVKPIKYTVCGAVGEVYETLINNNRVGILSACVAGGPTTSRFIEELVCFGTKYIIAFGVAGGLDPALPIGQQIVAKSGLSTDGTSKVYCPKDKEIYPDPELLTLVCKTGRTLSYEIKPVVVATVDVFYRETEDLVSSWRGMGADVINMETSPLYAASKICNLKSIWLGHVSDRLITDKWEDWYAGNRDEFYLQSAKIVRELVFRLLAP